MKKKVRYAAGIVGAAVPALGLMVPAATAATAHKPAVGKKTVTLLQQHRGVVAAPECTGKTEAITVNGDDSIQRFYWTNSGKSRSGGESVCIGTVKGYDADGMETGQGYFRVRIYDFPGNRGSKVDESSRHYPPTIAPEQFSWTHTYQTKFAAGPIEVCTAFVYQPGGVIRPVICHSVK